MLFASSMKDEIRLTVIFSTTGYLWARDEAINELDRDINTFKITYSSRKDGSDVIKAIYLIPEDNL